MRLRVAFDEKGRQSARSPPKNARYDVAALLFLCYLEFFRLASIMRLWDSWMAGARGWVVCLQRFFICMSFSLLSKFLEFHSSVFSFPVEVDAHVNQTSILVARVQGWGFRFRLPCSCFETRMQARLIRPHHTHNTCITRLLSLHEASIALHITCLIWCFTHLSRYIYLPTDSFPSVGG